MYLPQTNWTFWPKSRIATQKVILYKQWMFVRRKNILPKYDKCRKTKRLWQRNTYSPQRCASYETMFSYRKKKNDSLKKIDKYKNAFQKKKLSIWHLQFTFKVISLVHIFKTEIKTKLFIDIVLYSPMPKNNGHVKIAVPGLVHGTNIGSMQALKTNSSVSGAITWLRSHRMSVMQSIQNLGSALPNKNKIQLQ